VTPATVPVPVTTAAGESRPDEVAIEEPLEIRLTFGPIPKRTRHVLTVTMRTPGHDRDLALGHLATEAIVRHPSDILEIVADGPNELRVVLAPGVPFDPVRHARSGYTTSSCGVCGKQSIEACRQSVTRIESVGLPISAAVISSLPDRVRPAQPLFAATGGIHAAALFGTTGEVTAVREDVGRHNAVDKVLGTQFGRWPLSDFGLFVSGRASFELVQKAAVAGVPLLAAVGAPSSLAVALANDVGLTLCGFVRDGRFNIYSEIKRIKN
jgi:FdhD protein